MTRMADSLANICRQRLLDRKWLIAPSRRVGHQWIETLVRSGQRAVNLHPTTLLRLALEVAGPEIADEGLAVAGHGVGPLVVNAVWERLRPDGYLGRMQQSTELSATIYESLHALRMAGCNSDRIRGAGLENAEKAADIVALLTAFDEFYRSNLLVDEAEVLRRAVERVKDDPEAFCKGTLVLVPSGIRAEGLERQFLEVIPDTVRVTVSHPADLVSRDTTMSDIRLLANVGRKVEHCEPSGDGSVGFFRAVGEVNEVREALRLCLAQQKPLDELELLYTDAETYVPLIFATARRHFALPDRPGGVPITFADGVPASLSRPGRALSAWLLWMREGFPQRLLVEMIGDGLLNCSGDADLTFTYLMRLLRPISIGSGAGNYLPMFEQQVRSLRRALKEADSDDERRRRRLKGLQALQRLTKQLLELAHTSTVGSGSEFVGAAEQFLQKYARSAGDFDKYAADSLLAQLQERKMWLQRLDVTLDLDDWVSSLPNQTRVLASGPRSGHLHVAPAWSGGDSGRPRTIVVGLDDRRFPGTTLQDPILLDRERIRVSHELPTSAAHLRRKIDELAATLARLPSSVTLSWPCHDLTDDRKAFPSSFVLSAYRLVSGEHQADLEALNTAVGPPVSFAPTTADKALDQSERWLWRLSADEAQGNNQLALVESFFPHLQQGTMARDQRQRAVFGAYNGYVPQAGATLNPFADDGPVLSASALELAGRCPLAYFFRNGLGLYPPDELELDPDRWIDAAQFGLLLHEVFRRFMHELSRQDTRPQFERDHNRLATILQTAVREWRETVAPPNENAFRTQYWQLIRSSRIFLQDESTLR